MRLATLRDETPDGTLIVLTRDLARGVRARGIARTLQEAIERWAQVEVPLRVLADRLERSEAADAVEIDEASLAASLPRAWQWLDGSSYPSHGKLMQQAFGLPPIETTPPLMYQGMSDHFLGPCENVPFPSESDGIDFEGEFGVIVDYVPMGTSRGQALDHIRFLIQINDWSLRIAGAREMRTGFGWIHGKPACSMAPVAVTPDELGTAWRDGRIWLDLETRVNGEAFGAVPGGEGMEHGFHDLIAHAARTRSLVAGTIIGSGTVSSPDHRKVGSSCLAERRAIEMIEHGEPKTPFLRFGDRIRMSVCDLNGQSVFGVINQRVTKVEPV